jgi:hypothetical protein
MTITVGRAKPCKTGFTKTDENGNQVVVSLCKNPNNPTAGMTTSTNVSQITAKMRYATQIKNASYYRGGAKYYVQLPLNKLGSYPGAPGGYGAPIRNAF